MFDVDGTPLYTLDFSDFHECDERRELIKALTGISDLDYRLFSEEEMKEYEQKITVVYTNEGHFKIAEPYCDSISISLYNLDTDYITRIKALVDLIRHPKVKYIPLREGLIWYDLITMFALKRLKGESTFRRKHIIAIFAGLAEYLDNANTPAAKLIKKVMNTKNLKEDYAHKVEIPSRYFALRTNNDGIWGADDCMRLELELLEQGFLLKECNLCINHGVMDTFLTTNEEHFSHYFHGEKLIERKPMYRKKPYIQKQIFINCPSAQQMITDDFSDYEEKIAIQEVDRVTEYRSEEAFIMDSKPKFLSILKGAAIKRDNELIQALIRT